MDNVAEFKSEALRRGCDQHEITPSYRPPGGLPHFGGIAERLIGAMMEMVHELPSTTFSNPAQRGDDDHDSDGTATLTLAELQQWLALAVTIYHGEVHSRLRQTPAGRWKQGVAAAGSPATVTSEADAGWPDRRAIARADRPAPIPREISSRSRADRCRADLRGPLPSDRPSAVETLHMLYEPIFGPLGGPALGEAVVRLESSFSPGPVYDLIAAA